MVINKHRTQNTCEYIDSAEIPIGYFAIWYKVNNALIEVGIEYCYEIDSKKIVFHIYLHSNDKRRSIFIGTGEIECETAEWKTHVQLITKAMQSEDALNTLARIAGDAFRDCDDSELCNWLRNAQKNCSGEAHADDPRVSNRLTGGRLIADIYWLIK